MYGDGFVRRGFRVGSPLERFNNSLSRYNGRFLRTTNHEQRATAFSEAACELRPAGPLSLKLDERRTTYDEQQNGRQAILSKGVL